jgi:hypothetical protein
MRHLISLVLGVILAPVIYVLAGIANSKLFEHFVDNRNDFLTLAIGLVCILAAGGLYSVLVLARLSPVGTVLAGLILFIPSMWVLFDATGFDRLLPAKFLGVPGALQNGAGPMFLLAAVPLLATVFSPRRWRSSAQPSAAAVFNAAPAYATQATTAAPLYQPAGSYPTQAYQATTPASPTYTPPSYTTPSYSPAETTITAPRWDPDES